MTRSVLIPTLRSRWRVLLIAFVLTSLPGWVTALPVRALAGATLAGYPEGDALLDTPGGAWWVELLRLNPRSLQAGLSVLPWWSLAVAYLGLVTWTIVLEALSHDGGGDRWSLAASALRRLRPMSVVLALWLIVRGVIGAAAVLIVTWLAPALASTGNERTQTVTQMSFALVMLVLALLVRVPHDLAYAACVRHDEGGVDSCITGLAALRNAPVQAITSWASRAAASAVLVIATAKLTSMIGSRSTAHVMATAAIHQAVLVALVVLRADWLRHAILLVESVAAPLVEASNDSG
jgi:hypothetical protein